jgi:hypothetical protein
MPSKLDKTALGSAEFFAECAKIAALAERHAVLDSAPGHMRPAIALMMFTGLSPATTAPVPELRRA